MIHKYTGCCTDRQLDSLKIVWFFLVVVYEFESDHLAELQSDFFNPYQHLFHHALERTGILECFHQLHPQKEWHKSCAQSSNYMFLCIFLRKEGFSCLLSWQWFPDCCHFSWWQNLKLEFDPASQWIWCRFKVLSARPCTILCYLISDCVLWQAFLPNSMICIFWMG